MANAGTVEKTKRVMKDMAKHYRPGKLKGLGAKPMKKKSGRGR